MTRIELAFDDWKSPVLAIILHLLAGMVGLEPTTLRLTAGCSTIELQTMVADLRVELRVHTL